MAKPNYEELFARIAVETDPVIKEQLIQQTLVFVEELTPTEKNFFNYVNSDYIKDNPGETYFVDNTIFPFDDAPKAPSYVGTYYYDKEVIE